jgi:ketosteroid isomerase-like protein
MNREKVLGIIEDAYTARRAGNWEKLATYWRPDATYRFAGAPELLPAFPAAEAPVAQSVPALVEMFQFHGMEQLGAVVEGNVAVFRWRAELSRTGGKRITTEILDWFELDDEGLIRSLVQFGDTAMVARLMRDG